MQYLGNVVGGTPVRYVNVDIAAFKKAAAAQIAAGEPVWFGCDVGKMSEREQGALDREMYDLELLYATQFTADKAERVEYGHSVMTHAMVLTGVDLDDKGRPRRWKVENSWGDKVGDKGYFVMSDRWFDEYMFEVVVDRRHLPKRVLQGARHRAGRAAAVGPDGFARARLLRRRAGRRSSVRAGAGRDVGPAPLVSSRPAPGWATRRPCRPVASAPGRRRWRPAPRGRRSRRSVRACS